MSNSKISALTSATTPLAGTEVLPIVQSSTTKKVAVDDLTVKNIRSNATSGILQIAGPAAASTRVMTTPNANFTAARTDAAQSFTGDQTLSTGNLVIGTSGKGIDFSATAGTGTSELLADYEEGTFTATITPASGSITLNSSFNTLSYTKVGRVVTVTGSVKVSSVSSPSGTYWAINTLPFTSSNLTQHASYASSTVFTDSGGTNNVFPSLVANSSTTMYVYSNAASIAAGNEITFTISYSAT